MQKPVIRWFGRWYGIVLGAALLGAIASVAALVRLGLHEEYSIASFVGADHPEFLAFQDFIHTFGGSELAVIAVKTADASDPHTIACLKALVADTSRLDGVERVACISQIPGFLRKQWMNHPLLRGSLVSEDGRTAAVVLKMRDDSAEPDLRRRTVAQLRNIVGAARQSQPHFGIILTGPYVTMLEMFDYVREDLALFSIIVAALMIVTLYGVIGDWRAAVVIIGVGAASTLCTLGLTIALQLNMSLTMQMIVIMVSVLAVATCVHLTVARRELEDDQKLENGDDRRRSVVVGELTLQRMALPCTAVIVTSMAGFGAVTISRIQPIKLFGGIMAAGLLLSLAISLAAVFVLAAKRNGRGDPRGKFHSWLAALLAGLAERTAKHRVAIVGVFAVLILALIPPIGSLTFESNFVNNFRQDSSVRRGYEFVEHNLAPMNSFELIIRRADGRPVVDLHALQSCAQLSRWAVEEYEAIRKTLSIVDVLTLVQPDLPATETELHQQIGIAKRLLASASGQDAMDQFMTRDGLALRMSLRVVEAPSVRTKLEMSTAVQQRAGEFFGPQYEIELTGLYYFYATLIAGLLGEQNVTFALSLAAVFLCTALFFRSVRVAAVAMVPNLFPMLACLGMMGYLNIPVNMATSMMLSIALGIAVDDTVHYIWRFRDELRKGCDTPGALVNAHRSVGQACVFTTIVVAAGFWILCFSRFMPTAYFGALVGFTMLAALAADLVLLPALLLILKPLGSR